MKFRILLALTISCLHLAAVHAQDAPAGRTENAGFPSSFICVDKAEPLTSTGGEASIAVPRSIGSARAEDWFKLDSVEFDAWTPALGYFGFRFDRLNRRLEAVGSMPALSSAAQSAVLRSPKWLRADLALTLSSLPAAKQDLLAAVINDAPELMIDEIAFSIAHSSAAFLRSSFCHPQMFRENAELIYAHDALLPYVEIVEHGAVADGDFHSTVRYWRVDKDSNRVQVEAPRDIYYWYIVHPKLTDEISAYVDPNLPDGASAIKPPPQGKFWRDYLFTVTEPVPDTTGVDFPVLREAVKDCEVLWADRGTEKQAVLQIGKWIRDVLEFGSKTERPHQPVRIYKLHLGRCGEHGDVTAAAARACLIPCREVSAISSDHVWNEFWDEQWWQWEPVNNSQKNPLVYSEGWGKKFGSVFARRSDGVLSPVTDVYAKETCTLEIQCKDAAGAPVDGAMVLVAMRVDQSIYIDTFGATDAEGVARFILGKGNDYYARFDSPNAGAFPAQSNQVSQLMIDAQPGRQYAYQLKSSVTKPKLTRTNTAAPLTDAVEDFAVEIAANVGPQGSRWQQQLDDIRTVEPSVFFHEESAGNLDLCLLRPADFTDLRDRKPFKSAGGSFDARGALAFAEWNLDATDDFYLLFANGSNANNPVRVNGIIRLYIQPALDAGVPVSASADLAILDCHPSPVTAGVATLTLSQAGLTRTRLSADIHDMLGRKLGTQEPSAAGAGSSQVRIDTRGLRPGCYLLRLRGENGAVAQRLLQVR